MHRVPRRRCPSSVRCTYQQASEEAAGPHPSPGSDDAGSGMLDDSEGDLPYGTAGRRSSRAGSRRTVSTSGTCHAATVRWRCACTDSRTRRTPGATSFPHWRTRASTRSHRSCAGTHRHRCRPTAGTRAVCWRRTRSRSTTPLGADDRAVIIGHDHGAVAAHGAASAAPERWRRVVTLAVPPGDALLTSILTNLDQLKRFWYMFFFQHPFADTIVPAGDLAFVDRLWSEWSPGFDGSRGPRAAQAVAARSGEPGRSPRLLPGCAGRRRSRSCPRRSPSGDGTHPAATELVPAWPRRRVRRRRGRRDGRSTSARQPARRDRGRRRPLPPPGATRRHQSADPRPRDRLTAPSGFSRHVAQP